MLKLNFDPNSSKTRHVCRSDKEGEWIVYRCSQCDYVLKEHFKTGEKIVKNPKANVLHSGTFISPQLLETFQRMN